MGKPEDYTKILLPEQWPENSNYAFQITFITKTWGLDQKFFPTKGKSRAPFKIKSLIFPHILRMGVHTSTYRWANLLLGALFKSYY